MSRAAIAARVRSTSPSSRPSVESPRAVRVGSLQSTIGIVPRPGAEPVQGDPISISVAITGAPASRARKVVTARLEGGRTGVPGPDRNQGLTLPGTAPVPA